MMKVRRQNVCFFFFLIKFIHLIRLQEQYIIFQYKVHILLTAFETILRFMDRLSSNTASHCINFQIRT